MHKLTLSVILFLFSSFIYGQSIKGTVYRGNSDTTVANAVVYYSGSANGGNLTDEKGQFELLAKSTQVPIVASCVGYYSATVFYKPNEPLIIRLKPKQEILKEVVISGNGVKREDEVAMFLKDFLGTSKYSKSCVITNIDDIDLRYNKKTQVLKANCDKPIIIENKKLGYTISYYLDKFEKNPKTVSIAGNYIFKDNILPTDKNFAEIKKNREDAYHGSRMQFIRALWNHDLDRTAFEIYNQSYKKLTQDSIVVQDSSRQKYIHLTGRTYLSNLDEYSTAKSPLEQKEKYTFIDKDGYWDDGLVWSGTMGTQRMGDLLPFDFQSVTDKAEDPQHAGPIVELLKQFKTYPTEKVHLQTDKPYYSVGEDIWFKAYLADAMKNHLSSQSKILYIDLLDDRDSVRQTLLLPVQNGLASGNLHLNDSLLNAGNYHLVAYTKWMQNFGSEYFFKKDITLVNALHGAISGSLENKTVELENGKQLNAQITYRTDNIKPYANQPVSYTISIKDKTLAAGKGITDADGKFGIIETVKEEFKNLPLVVTTVLPKLGYSNITQDFVVRPLASVADVQFFPEGGHLVTGIRAKVGFKALKPDGLGEHISGYITEEGSNEHVAEFTSDHAGMGVFALQPVQGKNYIATIKHEDGSEKSYALPKAENTGYVLNVNHVGDSLSVRVSASANLLDGREVALVAQCNGLVQFAAKIKLDKGSNVSYISTKKFQTGISQFTLFSPDMTPVAERLVFVDHNDGLTAAIKTDKAGYNKRDKVNLNLAVTDAAGSPAVGSFSVAITDEGKVKQNEDDETSILSNLLLTSDIKGYIEQPNYYFNPANANRLKHLDELLLTQGWRRFSWADMQNNKFPQLKYPQEQSLAVSGNITNMSDKPISKSKVTLFATSTGGTIIADTVSDDNGHFVFDHLDFPDSAKIMVRAANAKNNATFNLKTTIDKKPRFVYAATNNNFTVANTGLANYLLSTEAQFDELDKFGLFKNSITLKEVKIQAKKNYYEEHTIPHSANFSSPGDADIVIKPEKLQQYSNLLYAFYGLPGVDVKNNQIIIAKTQHSLRVAKGSRQTALILLDGMEVDDVSMISPYDVAGVEILTLGSKTAVYGDAGVHGVVLITSKRGGDATPIDNSFNKAHYSPQGYSATKQFYSPQYDTPVKTQMADLRSTIYWNPDIITDTLGRATFSFFNADGTGNYKVTLEGMDTKGGLVRKVYTYVVK